MQRLRSEQAALRSRILNVVGVAAGGAVSGMAALFLVIATSPGNLAPVAASVDPAAVVACLFAGFTAAGLLGGGLAVIALLLISL